MADYASTMLQSDLIKELGWDAEVVNQVFDSIKTAKSAQEVISVAKTYIGDNPGANQAIQCYIGRRFGGTAAPIPTFQATTEDIKAAFDMGVNVKTRVKKSKAKENQEGDETQLSRKTVNCTTCGKIFDCRQPTGEVLRFLNSGGLCSFCGNRVRLEYSNGSTNISGSDADGPSTTIESTTSTAAQELKDRLVNYDRNAAKRTTIIDDQSDYFAIDSNAWLSREERETLKRQEAALIDAEEARRKKLLVSIDLLGRRVLMMDGEESIEEEERGDELKNQAMAATAAEKPHGGGTATKLIKGKRGVGASPSMQSAHYVYQPRGTKDRQDKKAVEMKEKAALPPRVQHDDPFELAARELKELLISYS